MELTPTHIEVQFEMGVSHAMKAPLSKEMPHLADSYVDGWLSIRPVDNERVQVELEGRSVLCVVTVVRKHEHYPHGIVWCRVMTCPAETHGDLIEDDMTLHKTLYEIYNAYLHSIDTPIVIQWEVK